MKLYFKNLVNYSFCFFLLLSLIIVSCKEKSQSLSETLNTETKLALSKDQDFITYSKVSKDFREKVSVDYYGYNKIDKSILNKELQTVKNDADFIKAYEKAGLNNAKEFVEYQMIQKDKIHILLQRYPYFADIGKSKAIHLILSLVDKPQFDKNKIKALAKNSNQ